ncbi:MAG: hypothetical protein HQL80_03965 [Magnetococcales bacterium]|nr:hypothetical protein [Magnetococcales bacterium]
MIGNRRFGLVLAVVLLTYGMGFLFLAGPLVPEGPFFRMRLAGQVVGSTLRTLMFGMITGCVIWLIRRYLAKNPAAAWRKPVLWSTGFWAVLTLIYRFILLDMNNGG